MATSLAELGLASSPLEFTRNLGGILQERLIGAVSAPLPKTDPMAHYRYLRAKRDMLTDAHRQRPLVRVQDEHLGQLARVAGEMSCRTEEIAADSGEAGVVIRGHGDYLASFVKSMVRLETDLHLSVDPVGTAPDWPTRWGGKITEINAKSDSSGIHTVELIATANREHLKTTLIAANPVSPPELQLPKMWFLPANARTGCSVTLAIQFARLFFPFLSIPTNIFNPGPWLATDIRNIDPRMWPMQVAFINAATDQSRTSVVASAWQDFHASTSDLLMDAGCTARAYTFFTDDPSNPHRELEALVGDDLAHLARPQRNCVVVAFEDNSGREGLTGTAADGLINLVATVADDLITNVVLPIDADGDGEVDPLIAKALGAAPKPPWAVYREGQHSGIIESQVSQHKGPIQTIHTGGKSPKLLNDLQTFGIRYGLSKLGEVVLGFEATGMEGIDNIYQGQLDNVAFAWQRYTDPVRALYTGDLAYREHNERGGGTAYVISSVLTLRVGWYKKRAYRSFKTSIRNCAPYIIGYDIQLDDRVGFEQDKLLYVDQVKAIKYMYDRKTPITYVVTIGDGGKQADPLLQGIKAIQGVASLAGMFLGEGTIFG